MLRPKKNSYKEFDNEKKFLRLKNSPPPPHNFSNGPSLNRTETFATQASFPVPLPISPVSELPCVRGWSTVVQ